MVLAAHIILPPRMLVFTQSLRCAWQHIIARLAYAHTAWIHRAESLRVCARAFNPIEDRRRESVNTRERYVRAPSSYTTRCFRSERAQHSSCQSRKRALRQARTRRRRAPNDSPVHTLVPSKEKKEKIPSRCVFPVSANRTWMRRLQRRAKGVGPGEIYLTRSSGGYLESERVIAYEPPAYVSRRET